MDASVRTAMRQSANRQLEGRSRAKDRSDRATVETVLDPRTRMVRAPMAPALPEPAAPAVSRLHWTTSGSS